MGRCVQGFSKVPVLDLAGFWHQFASRVQMENLPGLFHHFIDFGNALPMCRLDDEGQTKDTILETF